MKIRYLKATTASLTKDSIYTVLSQTSTHYFIADDTGVTNPYPIADFIPHYEVGSLSELVALKADTTDAYGTVFQIVSSDESRLRVNASDKVPTEVTQISYTKSYGGVLRALDVLESSYRFSIAYTQDPAKTFNDLDSLVAYTKSLGWKVCAMADGSLIITDSLGSQIIPEYVGINLTF